MANWTTRKSKSQRISKDANFRSTQTITTNKGITNSQSFGGKNGRTTFSTGPKGTKIYNTVRSGEYSKRISRTISSTKTRVRKGRKMTKKEAEAWLALFSSPMFWVVAFIVFILMGVA